MAGALPDGASGRRRTILAAAGAATLALAVALAAWRGSRSPPPDPAALVAAGRRLFAANCLHCHREVRLEGRVRGWDERRAYDAVGRLWIISPAMPHFAFSDEERRALAAWLVAIGSGAPY